MNSRWTALLRSLLVVLAWGVALLGLSTVFASGPWQGWAVGVAACGLLVPALLRVARPHARLVPCLVGLVAGAVPAVVPAWRAGRVEEWLGDPAGALGQIRVRLLTGDAPVAVDGVLLDGILLACVVLVWACALLVVGLDGGVVALLVPAALLLVTPAVLGVRVQGWLVAATAALVLAMVWVGAPPRVSLWRGGIAAVAALLVAVLVIAVLPASRDRVWNTSGVSLSPVSGDVPDVTVALGDDLRKGSTTEVFRFRGQAVGISQRFPLAVLADLDGGTWRPLEDTDQTLAAQPQRPWLVEGDASLYADLGVEQFRSQYTATVETTGLVSSWLPLPMNAVEVRPVEGTGQGTKALDASDWSWVSGTSTARSMTSLTSRGTTYSAVGLPYVDSSTASVEGDASYVASWPVAFSSSLAASIGSGADAETLATSLAPYLTLPGDVPEEITRTAKEVTSGAEDRVAAAGALARWFTSGDFTYDESAPYTPGTDPDDPYSVMEAFLTTRSGYCVHFASTFTVMARSLGMPTRLVVGYAARSATGWSSVSARNLHAWPEVYFEGVGWVAIEPTPGGAGWRADTGSDETAPQEILSGPSASSSASASASTEGGAQPSTSPTSSASDADSDGQSGAGAGGGTGQDAPSWAWLWGVVGVLIAGVLVVTAPRMLRRWRRVRRRRRVGAGGRGAASAAWAEFADTARDLGWVGDDEDVNDSPRAHTPEALVEYLVSAGALPGEAQEAAGVLARAVVEEHFGGDGAGVLGSVGTVGADGAPGGDGASDGGGPPGGAALLAALDTATSSLREARLIVTARHASSGH